MLGALPTETATIGSRAAVAGAGHAGGGGAYGVGATDGTSLGLRLTGAEDSGLPDGTGTTMTNDERVFHAPTARVTPTSAPRRTAAATRIFHGSMVCAAGRIVVARMADRTRAGGSAKAMARSPDASASYPDAAARHAEQVSRWPSSVVCWAAVRWKSIAAAARSSYRAWVVIVWPPHGVRRRRSRVRSAGLVPGCCVAAAKVGGDLLARRPLGGHDQGDPVVDRQCGQCRLELTMLLVAESDAFGSGGFVV